jgi:hypothetical protein
VTESLQVDLGSVCVFRDTLRRPLRNDPKIAFYLGKCHFDLDESFDIRSVAHDLPHRIGTEHRAEDGRVEHRHATRQGLERGRQGDAERTAVPSLSDDAGTVVGKRTAVGVTMTIGLGFGLLCGGSGRHGGSIRLSLGMGGLSDCVEKCDNWSVGEDAASSIIVTALYAVEHAPRMLAPCTVLAEVSPQHASCHGPAQRAEMHGANGAVLRQYIGKGGAKCGASPRILRKSHHGPQTPRVP